MPKYDPVNTKATFGRKKIGIPLAIPYDASIDMNPYRARERAEPATPAPQPKAKAKPDARKRKPEAAPKEKSEAVISSRQIRAGRALLAWSQKELADAAKVSRATLMRIEADAPDTKASTLKAIAETLKANGVRLYDDSDGIGEGARMAKPDDTQA